MNKIVRVSVIFFCFQTTVDAQGEACVAARSTIFGVAYSLWHNDMSRWSQAWGKPQIGFYLSSDPKVMSSHATMLNDALIDFVYIDWSNDIDTSLVQSNGKNLQIEENTLKLFETWKQLEKSPKIAIMLGIVNDDHAIEDGKLQKKADEVFDLIVTRYPRLYQTLEMRPLLIVYVNTPSPFQHGLPPWTDKRFTVKWMTGFLTDQSQLMSDRNVSKYGYWSWEDKGTPSHVISNGRCEEINIVAAWRGNASHPSPGRNNGETFKEEWQEANRLRPEVVLLGTFNEWLRGEQPSPESSKDLEPSSAFGNQYLEIVRNEISKYRH